MVCGQHTNKHDLETKEAVKVLKDMNIKCMISPDAGVDKFKQEHAQALKEHVKDLMERFRAKSSCWIVYSED